VPFDGGYEGLRTLSDQGFSGAVTAGPAQLFMLNGTVVGIVDGDIGTFEDATGTARAAPHDALPLLVVMQDRADSPRAQYYTQDTPISEVDRTLEDGNFTGFVELSENVLSGDYYLVYHQGRSMSVAWVGSSKRLITDEDAFEQADDEVGIYKVIPAEITPIDLPEPEDSGADDGAVAADTPDIEAAEPTDSSNSDSSDEGPPSTVTDEPRSPPDDDSGAASRDEAATDRTETAPVESATTTAPEGTERDRGAGGPPGSKAAGASQGSAVEEHQREREGTETREARETQDRQTADTSVAEAESESEPQQPADSVVTEAEQAATTKSAETAHPAEPDATPVDPTAEQSAEPDESGPATAEPAGREQSVPTPTDSDAVGSLETRSIPSLDPERSSTTPQEPATQTAATSAQSTPTKRSSPEPAQSEPSQTKAKEPATAASEPQSPGTAELEADLEERVAEIAELEAEIRELSTENEELAAERDQLLSDLEEARAEIQRLEEQLAASGDTGTGGVQLSAAEAIDGTNLFVRYHSKGEATLEKAQDGGADRAAVDENLRLEYHTQFDGEDAVVDGDSFEEFLHDSIQYRFVDWLVGSLLYEIRDTGHESAMGVLYDALPEVDRAELNGKVSVTYTEDGQEHRSQEQFDVVVRDRMGNPLVVANINDSREPATEGQMTDIVRNAERVGNASDSLAAAFLVTSSFFEPGALETAKEATSSGLFSRDKRKSFVNLSRKGGYHLCLLEARNKEFHLAVPEL
jgi:hypothetical protein